MKTPEQILIERSPTPHGGYKSSWIIEAMKEYALQWVDITQKELDETPRWDACVDRIKDWITKQ